MEGDEDATVLEWTQIRRVDMDSGAPNPHPNTNNVWYLWKYDEIAWINADRCTYAYMLLPCNNQPKTLINRTKECA